MDETTEQFARSTRSPIGFIAFDIDYYSSTVQSFRIFAAGPESRLPRVYCYFDDLVWPEEACHNDYSESALDACAPCPLERSRARPIPGS